MSKGQGQALGSIFGTGGRRASKRSDAAATEPSPPEAAAATPATVAAFLSVVDRVEALLDVEIEILTCNIPADMSEIGNRKRQGLLEMSRALRATMAAGPRADIRERLGRFAAKAERNRTVLGTQLRAVREIADILAQTIREAESDGTYSPVRS